MLDKCWVTCVVKQLMLFNKVEIGLDNKHHVQTNKWIMDLIKEIAHPFKQQLAPAKMGGIKFAETTTLKHGSKHETCCYTTKSRDTWSRKIVWWGSEGRHSVSSHEINLSKYDWIFKTTPGQIWGNTQELGPKELSKYRIYNTNWSHISDWS